MKGNLKKVTSFLLASTFFVTAMTPTAFAAHEGGNSTGLIGDREGIYTYEGDKGANAKDKTFIKISHPEKPVSTKEFDPLKSEASRKKHEQEVHADGLLDYISNCELGVPFVDEGANGQGDRGQTYSWAGFAYGDWMYVSTLFNSTEQTGRLLGTPFGPAKMDKTFGGDMFTGEPDDTEGNVHVSGSTLCKVNVKTGEVKIIMSKTKNGLETSFRNAVAYNDKLYFCGSVNHLPSIFEIDPTTDAFQCVYQDPSIRNHPGGPGAAWAESLAKEICPTIRGLGVYQGYLVISAVGIDGNPYIAVSKDPSEGFTQIASTWKNVDTREKGELLGYPACKIPDSIMGGSIWEMVEFNDSLYVAIATGTPDNAPLWHYQKDKDGNYVLDKDGNKIKIIDTMQPFAIIRGDHDKSKPVDDRSSWTWVPIVGDDRPVEEGGDGALYPFGIDPDRHRSSACNLVVFKDHLYIGEYNETQIAFNNMTKQEFDFLCKNMDESVSMYRLDKNDHIEKVMGDPTPTFPTTVSGKHNESGFGRREMQYIWQTRVFDGKLYIGTFDETQILTPIARAAFEMFDGMRKTLDADLMTVDAALDQESAKNGPKDEELESLLEARQTYNVRMQNVDMLSDVVAVDDSETPVPEEIFEKEPLIRVDSPESLYMAMQLTSDLLASQTEEQDTTERLSAFVQFSQLREEMASYCESHEDEIPQVLQASASTFAARKDDDRIKDLGDIIKYLQNCIPGFDMYMTEDGKNFKQITRTGMGDVYNQGLRVFAVNDSKENPWMCIGTANPFYGTQIWRMEYPKMVRKALDPAQEIVKVTFMNNGQPMKRVWDRADEIFVNEGVTSVAPEALDILVPDTFAVASQKPLEIQTGADGVKYINVDVVPADRTVSLNFVSGDGNAAGTRKVEIPQSVKAITAQMLTENEWLPAGSVLIDAEAEYAIQEVKDGDGKAYTATIPVRMNNEIVVNGGKATVNGEEVSIAMEGTVVTLTADKPAEGKPSFVNWSSENGAARFADANAAQTTFVMPGTPVTIDAMFGEGHKITVTNGTASTGLAVEGSVVNVTANKPGENQTFAGWTGDDAALLKNAKAAETILTMPAADVALTASYSEIYNVFFNANGGTGDMVRLQVTEGESVKLPSCGFVAPADKYFAGWAVNSTEGEVLQAGDTFKPQGSVTLYALWSDVIHPEFKIGVNKDKNGTVSFSSETAEEGTIVTITPSANEGFGVSKVTGYRVASLANPDLANADLIKVDANSDGTYSFVMPDSDVYVEVVFGQIFTVSFDANGGTGEMAPVEAVEGMYMLPACEFTAPEGKEFGGWLVRGRLYQANQQIDLKGDVTVKARWANEKADTYMVVYDANGGTGEMPDGTATEGLGFVLPECSFTAPEGQIFLAWQIGEDSETTTKRLYDAGAEASITEETLVKAVWGTEEDKKASYTVTFDANGGTGSMDPRSFTEGTMFRFPESSLIAPEGQEFKGWALGEQEYTVGDELAMTGDITVKALWQEKISTNSTLSGYITHFGAEGETVTIELRRAISLGNQPAYSTTVSGGSYSIPDVKAGKYTLRAYMDNHVTREYSVEVTEEDAFQDIELNRTGDVNGDGKVNMKDWNLIYKHINSGAKLEGYALECANLVGGPTGVDQNDWERMYGHINKTNPLW